MSDHSIRFGDVVGKYILAYWRGEQGLLKSFLINGVLIYFILVARLVSLGQVANSAVLTFVGVAIFVFWMIWACVGNFRCGIRNTLNQANHWRSRLGGVIVVISVLLVAFFSIKEMESICWASVYD